MEVGVENKKTLWLSIAIALVLVALIAGVLFWFLNRQPSAPISTQPVTTSTPTTTTSTTGLPTSNTSTNAGNGLSLTEQLQKEKQFISSWYSAPTGTYQVINASNTLPLASIKDQVSNYRDFSRKVPIDPHLERLSTDGSITLSWPFDKKAPTDWETAYGQLKDGGVPLFISSDALLGVYQDTLHVIYKEIEQEIFYPSLWTVLHDLASKVQRRYEARRLEFGIENDLITEAQRLELAYLSVGLELLKPKPAQVKESFALDKKFFTPQEAAAYTYTVPSYLANEVAAEIKLIEQRTPGVDSPLFLYLKNYADLVVPQQYLSSERLRNYYLAINWLSETLFPLWHKQNNCPECFLDEPDHRINFVAGAYLSYDLASNQTLKNQWANIYKSVAFFRGLETNLTYLDYHRTLQKVLGEQYNLDIAFDQDEQTIKNTISAIQNELNAYQFPELLSGPQVPIANRGLRLLRDRHLIHNTVFTALTDTSIGAYRGTLTPQQPAPITACNVTRASTSTLRCFGSALDLMALLGNTTAQQLLTRSGDDNYQSYQPTFNALQKNITAFDASVWHDNSYMALLHALNKRSLTPPNALPHFMRTAAWQYKTLNTTLASWTNSQREIKLERITPEIPVGLESYFGYGYIEPQPELYAELLANVRMIKQGFSSLQILNRASKPLERLTNLEVILEQAYSISVKELSGAPLTTDDYNFINGFVRKIATVTGDIAKNQLANIATVTHVGSRGGAIATYLDGLRFTIIIYPDTDGKLLFAIGPTLGYAEGRGGRRTNLDWQKMFNAQ